MNRQEENRLLGVLQDQLKEKQKKQTKNTSSLGTEARTFLNTTVKGLGKKAAVVDVWQQLIPEGLKAHTRLRSVDRGIITVEAEPGPFMFELRSMAGELLRHLKHECPRSGLRKIQIVAMRDVIEEEDERRKKQNKNFTDETE